jgi:type II secretory pathway pseudopilin PulG
MKKAKLKWFTLVEMLIVMVIIWILAVVLTESYLTISRTALRVEQEKNLSEESLVLTQIFQSISDEATIDYDAYNSNDLESNKWFTNVLHLTWDVWSWTSIYSTGENCLNLDWNFTSKEDKIQNHTWCYLVLNQNWDETPLTSPWKVVLSEVKFKIIPYDSDENYFNNSEWIVINDLHQPAFWMFVHLYAPLYQPTGTNKIDQPLQLFFNLKL